MIAVSGTLRFPLLLCLAIACYASANRILGTKARTAVAPELLVSLPMTAQVLFAAGDRYLAANLSGFRVLVADTQRMHAADFAVQARLQRDLSLLNPAHEDNYYIAAATLPWAGHLVDAQMILRRAADARPFDWQPLFYYGFHHYHFLKDPAAGARALQEAVPRAQVQQDAWALESLAAKWIERGYQTTAAAGLVAAMADNAPAGNFKKYLGVRAARLRDLARLQELATAFESRHGRPLHSIDELVSTGSLAALPRDPLGAGYRLDEAGKPQFGDVARRR